VEEIVIRFVNDLVGRLTGPLTLRIFLQPAVATIFAIRDGLRDARTGRQPHFWRMATGPADARSRRVQETWKAVAKIFTMAVVLDCVYQLMVFRFLYPVEALVTAIILAVVPYVALRGVVTRLGRSWVREEA
jgi:hypothetical protein